MSITELEPFEGATGSRMANAAIASIDYARSWEPMAPTRRTTSRRASACGPVPASSRAISPTRGTSAKARYRFDIWRHHVQVSGMAGGITGQAPLFERFTLGDSTRLRGWDKYEIAPAGGDRVVYAALDYRYTGLALFFDVGSVWDANTERRVRASAGFGFQAGPAFLSRRLPPEYQQPERRRRDRPADPGVGVWR